MKIGVFDSGYGGLTILREMRRRLPEYDYMYLGDNARAPYGTHSFDVIYSYTLQAVEFLFSRGCTLVVLACNTASAKALRTIQQKDLPRINALRPEGQKVNVLGVIRPTVEVVPEMTQTGHIGVLATPATVSSESYVLELEKISSPSRVLTISQQACPLWVPIVEAGEYENAGADYFVDKYLHAIYAEDSQIDTLVLGCTHYPLLLPKIEKWASEHAKNVRIVAQGTLVADSLADYLLRHGEYRSQLSQNGTCVYLTTENANRFSQSASLFIGSPVRAEHICL
ncbi:MAG: glutamate racemase [Paludibacteraceae bacterium]|nr:glutamate racemase [Paludibacteraceae bacterium]